MVPWLVNLLKNKCFPHPLCPCLCISNTYLIAYQGKEKVKVFIALCSNYHSSLIHLPQLLPFVREVLSVNICSVFTICKVLLEAQLQAMAYLFLIVNPMRPIPISLLSDVKTQGINWLWSRDFNPDALTIETKHLSLILYDSMLIRNLNCSKSHFYDW